MILFSVSITILLAQFNDVIGTPIDLVDKTFITEIYESAAQKLPSKVYTTYASLPSDGETAVDDVDETDDPQEVPSAAAAVGCLDGDCTSGKGAMKYSSGAEYVGEFLNGARNGMGVYTYGTETNAQGRSVQSPTVSYSGMFRNNMKHGKGVLTWRNGNKYDGDFIDNQIQGFGIKTYKDGRIYEGNWKDGKRAGYGHLTQKDGSHYFGQYKDNQKHDVSGYALYIKATGSKWFTKYDSGKLVKSQVINTEEWVENKE